LNRRILIGALAALAGCAGLQPSIADPTKRDQGTECASSAECPSTTTCRRGRCEYDGKIVSPQQPPDKTLHASCERDQDCNSGELCIAKFCEPKDLTHQ
jgi:hypothetical protein